MVHTWGLFKVCTYNMQPLIPRHHVRVVFSFRNFLSQRASTTEFRHNKWRNATKACELDDIGMVER